MNIAVKNKYKGKTLRICSLSTTTLHVNERQPFLRLTFAWRKQHQDISMFHFQNYSALSGESYWGWLINLLVNTGSCVHNTANQNCACLIPAVKKVWYLQGWVLQSCTEVAHVLTFVKDQCQSRHFCKASRMLSSFKRSLVTREDVRVGEIARLPV